MQQPRSEGVRIGILAAAMVLLALAVNWNALRLPRSGFQFVFETGDGELVDTRHGVVTKDLVDRADTTIQLRLSRQEMDRIYQKMISIRFFDMPEPHPPYPATGGGPPNTTVRLEATAGTVTRRLSWDSQFVDGGPRGDDNWKRLYELLRLIRTIVAARPEYQALPRAMAGYE